MAKAYIDCEKLIKHMESIFRKYDKIMNFSFAQRYTAAVLDLACDTKKFEYKIEEDENV